MRHRPLVALLVVAFAAAPAADAATVQVDAGVTSFDAALGEVNDVTLDTSEAGVVVFQDDGAALTAGAGCIQVDVATARCPAVGGAVSLGDGDDRMTLAPGLELEVRGDGGDDVLVGAAGADVLRGGEGDDRLAGLGGPDVMEGGGGDDLLDASEREGERTEDADELRCGGGEDRVAEPDIYDRASSCERIAIGGGLVVDSATLVKRSGPRVEVVVRCARSARRCATNVASAAASGVAFNPPLRVRLAPGARKRLVLTRFHRGAKARLRRSKVIAFGTKDHGFAVRVKA